MRHRLSHLPLAVCRELGSLVARPLVRVAWLNRATTTDMFGLHLRIQPGVFHPALFGSSRVLGEYLQRKPLRDRTVLDMGTGSGIQGLLAERQGASVTGIDINPAAVTCAEENARMNGCPAFHVLEGDLYAALPPTQSFDCIVWNPPFFPRDGQSLASRAWLAGDNHLVIRRFVRESRRHLRSGGSVLIVLSTAVDLPVILGIFHEGGWNGRLVSIREGIVEDFLVFEFVPRDTIPF